MKINDYTVVSCNECEEVWIVNGLPESSSCPRCGKTRRFKLLKKYASVESRKKAGLIRSQVKAKMSGDESQFNALLESTDMLTDNILQRESNAPTFESVFDDAIENCDTVDEFRSYFKDSEFSVGRAEKLLTEKRVNGEIIESGTLRYV